MDNYTATIEEVTTQVAGNVSEWSNHTATFKEITTQVAGNITEWMTSSTNYIPPMAWELKVEGLLGVSQSQLRFALALFASVAAGASLRFIRSPTLRHMYSLATGLILIYYPFGQNIINLVPPALVSYASMVLARRHCGAITWAFTFPYLIVLHVLAASGLSWSAGNMDFTGGMMVAVLKIITTAVCYEDHIKLKKRRPEAGEPSRYQVAYALEQLPNPLEYAAYLVSFGNLLAGPYLEYKDYKLFIEHGGKWAADAVPKPPPAPWRYGCQLVGESLLFLLSYLYLEAHWSPSLARTPWFTTHTVAVRLLILLSLGIVYQLRYFFVWKLSESSLTFAGLNFDQWKDGKPVWGRYENCNFLAVQLSDSARISVANWNRQTGNFLRRYVYERLAPKPAFKELLVTQVVSGIWHGMYPGYFLCFVSSALWLHNSTVIFKWQQSYLPAVVANSWAWHFVKVFWTNQFLNYMAQSFIILTFKETFRVWGLVYYIPHVLVFLMAALSIVFPGRRDPKKAKKKPE